jgi:hypothetical protein
MFHRVWSEVSEIFTTSVRWPRKAANQIAKKISRGALNGAPP